MAKPMVAENYFVTKGKLKNLAEGNRELKKENRKITEENQKLIEENKVLKAYNEQMQNENSYLGEQVDIYKEGYEVSKGEIIELKVKLEAYKEVLRLVLKENK